MESLLTYLLTYLHNYLLLYSVVQVQLIVTQPVKKYPAFIMETEGSLPRLQKFTTGVQGKR
jgi:hypothetical protein